MGKKKNNSILYCILSSTQDLTVHMIRYDKNLLVDK